MDDDGFQPFAQQQAADDSFAPFGGAQPAPVSKKALPKHVRASEAAGTRTPDNSYGSRFGAAATRSILGNPGGIQMLADPMSTLHALSPNEFGIPHGAIDNLGTAGHLLTGDPEAWGNLLPQLPFMLMGAGENGLPSAEQAAGAVRDTAGPAMAATRGALRGAKEGAIAPDPMAAELAHIKYLNRFPALSKVMSHVPGPLLWGELGELAGRHLPLFGGPGLGELGAAAGLGYPVVRGAIRGGREGLEAYRQSKIPPDLPPVYSGNPTTPEGRFDPAQYSAGANPVVPPVETGGGQVPTFVPERGIIRPRPGPKPPLVTREPISGKKTVGRFDVNQYGLPPIRPVASETVNVEPALEKLSALVPPVQPMAQTAAAAAPQGEIATGLHLPEVPKHYAGEPNPTAAFKNDQAIVAELRKVPGITQDTLTPEMVHEVRKSLGQRKLKDADVERRVGHIRQMLSK